jgi:glycosyltransferase involved in cell wall biosynthesis
MKINLYYWNNGVGVVNDSILIKNVLHEYDVITYDISKNNNYRNSDLGIFIQNIQADQLSNNKKNVLLINEEWLNPDEILFLKQFDHLIVKSKYAKDLLSSEHPSIIQTGFFSMDRQFFPKNTGNILHFKGKSVQKNTELVNKCNSVKILDSEIEYLTENQVVENLNSHDIHICCSLYEGWGHYLWEAMSCGKLVICSKVPVFKEYLDPELVKFIPTKGIYKKVIGYEFLDTKIYYKYRQGYFVDKVNFDELLNNKEELFEFQKKNSDNIRQHFLHVNKINKQKFLNMIEYIIYG